MFSALPTTPTMVLASVVFQAMSSSKTTASCPQWESTHTAPGTQTVSAQNASKDTNW